MSDFTIENSICRAVANAARAPAAICISKQVPFFTCTTCRKLTQNATKCTNIVHLWQWFEGQGFRLEITLSLAWEGCQVGHTNWLKWDQEWLNVASAFSMDGTVAEGGKLGRLVFSHRPAALLTPWQTTTHYYKDQAPEIYGDNNNNNNNNNKTDNNKSIFYRVNPTKVVLLVLYTQ